MHLGNVQISPRALAVAFGGCTGRLRARKVIRPARQPLWQHGDRIDVGGDRCGGAVHLGGDQRVDAITDRVMEEPVATLERRVRLDPVAVLVQVARLHDVERRLVGGQDWDVCREHVHVGRVAESRHVDVIRPDVAQRLASEAQRLNGLRVAGDSDPAEVEDARVEVEDRRELLGLRHMQAVVLPAAEASDLLCREQHHADRASRPHAQLVQHRHHLPLHHRGPQIVLRATAHIPRVQVGSNRHNLVRLLRALDLRHNVPALSAAGVAGSHLQSHSHRLPLPVQPIQHRRFLHRQREGWDVRNVGVVSEEEVWDEGPLELFCVVSGSILDRPGVWSAETKTCERRYASSHATDLCNERRAIAAESSAHGIVVEVPEKHHNLANRAVGVLHQLLKILHN
eukprot:1925076-Rhodomonas_salina.2